MSNNEIQPNFLFENIKNLIKESQNRIITAISNTMSLTYFEIGRMIVEEEQKGELRANYGKQIIKTLSIKLTKSLILITSISFLRLLTKPLFGNLM